MRNVTADNIATKAIRAAKWNYAGVLARIVIQLAAQIVLARLIGPSEFGYYSLVFMVVGIAYLISEFGLTSALIQSKTLAEDDIRSVWSYLLVASVFAAVALAALIAPLASATGLENAEAYLRWTAVPLTIQLLSSIALALLRRGLDFKQIQLAQVTGMLVGQVGVGFVLAWLLHSAWALVIGWTVQLAVAWGIMYWKVRHRLIPTTRLTGKHMVRFGIGAWGANIANWSIENLHMILAGRLFGATTLGLYSVSSNLVRYPTNHLVTTLQAVMFPASAAAQERPAALRAGYLAALSLVLLVTVPTFVSAAILAEPLILLLYGPDWLGAVQLVQPLALAMPLHSITAVSGPLLWGTGQVGKESGMQWLTLGFFLAVAYLTGLASPVTLAWIVLATYALRAVLISRAAMAMLGISPRMALSALIGSLVLGIASGIITSGIHHLVGDSAPFLSIVVSVVTVLAAAVFLLWLSPTTIIAGPLAALIRRSTANLPDWFVARMKPIAHSSTD